MMDILRENLLPGKIDFPENETSYKMRLFAFMCIRFNGYIWKHGYLDILDFLGEHTFPGKLGLL